MRSYFIKAGQTHKQLALQEINDTKSQGDMNIK